MDRLSADRRSWNMGRIRSRDTGIEMAVRRHLHGLGYRYRLTSSLPGKPDLVFPRQRIAVFVHGCFFHRHGCHNSSNPKSNRTFWEKKFARTVERDAEVEAELREQGWTVVVLWGCEVERDVATATKGLKRLLGS